MTDHQILALWKVERGRWQWGCSCGHSTTSKGTEQDAFNDFRTHREINILPRGDSCDGC